MNQDRIYAWVMEHVFGEKIWHHESGLDPSTPPPPLPNCEIPVSAQPRWCRECTPGVFWCAAHSRKCGKAHWDACPLCFRVMCLECSDKGRCPCFGAVERRAVVLAAVARRAAVSRVRPPLTPSARPPLTLPGLCPSPPGSVFPSRPAIAYPQRSGQLGDANPHDELYDIYLHFFLTVGAFGPRLAACLP